jgi:pyruvate, water dikinase
MIEKKEASLKSDFVKWFSELNKDSGKVAGGKGANLSEIYNLKIPVPPGFVVTAQAYDAFIKSGTLNEKIKKILETIDFENTEQLNEKTKEIRELIMQVPFPTEMQEDILESYENLGTEDFHFERGNPLDILNKTSEEFVAVRSSATTEDLADASFAGQQDTYLNIKGKTDVLKHIKMCFASLFTSRATYYRNKKGFKYEQASLAVVVQKMVDADKSGVIFSKNPSYKEDNVILEAVWGLGEGIVSGKITPDKYIVTQELEVIDKKIANKKIAITRDSSGSKAVVKLREEKSKHQVLKEYEIKKLAEMALKLEDHYKTPQDIEFAIEGEEIYIVQTRPITTIANRVEKNSKELKGEVILEGLAASPGIASGKIKIIEDLADLKKIIKGDILVTKMTNPDMVVSMQKSAAIVTDEGGLTAHAAIVSREMGIPCIVGAQEATTKLKEGETITVDGFSGKVYKGKIAESVQKEVLPVEAQTKTEIKVMVDLPSFAKRAAKTGIKKVGLTRIEGIIAESGKHPEYFLKQDKIEDYQKIIFKGVNEIAEDFEEIWVRTSDIRTDEFSNLEGAPKEKEANPMLGNHGIRYSLKNPKVLKAELSALQKVSKTAKIGILMPQVISVDELKKVKEVLKEINFTECRVGIMIETPAAVQLIRDFCEEGIDFISFGTNDLTQYILAIDRGNQEVQNLYDEMHPAVLHQLEFVIRVCKRYKVQTSICGQAGSKKPMAKFLVEKGIDSISVNADVAKDIAEHVAQVEKEMIEGTDKEPRQYQPEKVEPQNNSQESPKNPAPETAPPKVENKEEINPNIEKDIQAIEQEKKEYVQKEKNIPENNSQESSSNPNPETTPLKTEVPEEKVENTPPNIEKDIQAIEQEKKEYVQEHPVEKTEEENENTNEEKLDIF